jgi:hypothetical protein
MGQSSTSAIIAEFGRLFTASCTGFAGLRLRSTVAPRVRRGRHSPLYAGDVADSEAGAGFGSEVGEQGHESR